MEQIAIELPEVELVKSVPGVSDKLAAVLVAEIGNAKQFQDAKQLVAYAGLDPGIFSSGKFTATSSRITKRDPSACGERCIWLSNAGFDEVQTAG